jgi:hypothetical protein
LPGGFGGDAIGHADSASAPVVAAGSEPPRCEGQVGIDDDALQQTELGQVEGRGFFVGASEADQVIEDLSYTDGGENRLASGQ